MKAYKFRSADEFHFLVDILLNKRLYCCPADALNDLREGDIRIGSDNGREIEIFQWGLELNKKIKDFRVCSLTTSFENHLLWAHYARGYSGIAIEVEIDDEDVIQVSYNDEFLFCSDLIDLASIDAAARRVLARKYEDWSYEKEVRIITESSFYRLTNPISRIIVGSRTSPAIVSALYLICNHFGIAVDRLVIADWGFYTVGTQPMHL